MAQITNFIRSITVSRPDYPLYDHLINPTQCYYSMHPVVIWSQQSQSPYPVAVTKSAKFSIKLDPAGLQANTRYTLTATLAGQPVFAPQDVTSATTELKDLTLSDPTVNSKPKSLPWTLWADVVWVLSLQANVVGKCSTSIEIYVLFPKISSFFDAHGLPLAFLRLGHYMRRWMATPEDAGVDWPAFAVDAVFTDPRLEYEAWRGTHKYTHWGAAGVEMSCWFDLWLADITGAAGKGAIHSVNCHDLAGVCQVIMSLGLAPSRTVFMKYMEPYGFINKTHLIGKKQKAELDPGNKDHWCNNPFFESTAYDPQMLCKSDSPKRSQFGHHVFLTITKAADTKNEYVMDACCGPQLGGLPLKDYPAQAIDTHGPYRGNQRPGTEKNIRSGHGVTALVSSFHMERTLTELQNDPKTLMNQLQQHLNKSGSVLDTYKSANAAIGMKMTVTWTFIPKENTEDVQTLNILTYKTAAEAFAAYRKLLSISSPLVTDWEYADKKDMYDAHSDNMRGSCRIFTSKDIPYVAILEAKVSKAKATEKVKNTLQPILKSCIASSLPNYLDKATLKPLGPKYFVKDMIALQVTLTTSGDYAVISVDIQVQKGNLILIESASEGKNMVFVFVARSHGPEEIALTVSGGNLEAQTRTFKVIVEPSGKM